MSDRNEDRALLQEAARAAGIELVHWNDGGEPYSSGKGFILPNNRIWNPLTDDGDAFRLAVRLDLIVMPYPADRGVRVTRLDLPDFCEHWGPGVTGVEATRRAIVRAAASLGKDAG